MEKNKTSVPFWIKRDCVNDDLIVSKDKHQQNAEKTFIFGIISSLSEA